jgi:hypothetical protein
MQAEYYSANFPVDFDIFSVDNKADVASFYSCLPLYTYFLRTGMFLFDGSNDIYKILRIGNCQFDASDQLSFEMKNDGTWQVPALSAVLFVYPWPGQVCMCQLGPNRHVRRARKGCRDSNLAEAMRIAYGSSSGPV